MGFVNGVTLSGWGVVRNAPWHFVGLFTDRAEAEAKARQMGDSYEVHWGDNQEGTDNFIWSSFSQP